MSIHSTAGPFVGLSVNCLSIVLLLSMASAQPTPVILHTEVGAHYGSCFGAAGVGLGDLDQDGIADFAVGASSTCGVIGAGAVFVYSGRTGALLYEIQGSDPNGSFGTALARIDDLDSDGFGDIAVGAPGVTVAGIPRSGAVYLYSGGNGNLLRTLDEGPSGTGGGRLGASLAEAGDLDGDGRSELLVGAPTAGPGGAAFVYSTNTGAHLYPLMGSTPDAGMGTAVAVTGDVNGDGTRDLLVGAPGFLVTEAFNPGSVFVFSGSDGGLIRRVDGTQVVSSFGSTLAPLPDLDADGIPDFAAGAPTESGATGAIHYLSGATGLEIRSIVGAYAGFGLGTSMATIGDVNGDGVEDLAAGIPFASVGPTYGAGVVHVYSTSNDSLLMEILGPGHQANLGAFVAGADVNGDGRSDVIAGAPAGQVDCRPFTGIAVAWGFGEIRPARAVAWPMGGRIQLVSGKPTFDFLVEPIAGSFVTGEILPSTLVLRPVAPGFEELRAVAGSVRTTQDLDGNGIDELLVPFLRQRLRCLFPVPPSGEVPVAVFLEGTLASGVRVRGTSFITVVSAPAVQLSVAPNPFQGEGALSFRTTIPGYGRIRMYDLHGRLVRVPLETTWLPTGYHDLLLESEGSRGERLSSGIYFISLETAEGSSTRKVAILR